MKLTKSICDRAKYEGGGGFFALWDDAVSGFGLRVYPSGAKSFIIQYRVAGRQRIITLGKYGVMTVEQGRRLAKEKLVEAMKGEDPAVKKRQQASGDRIKDLAHDYLENCSKPNKKSWKEDQRRIETRIIPALGNKRILGVQRAEIAAFHKEMGKRGRYEANRILALVSSMYGYAKREEIIPPNHPNPCQYVDKFKEESRDVFVKLSDLPRLIEAIEQENNIYVRGAIMLYLLTGARKTELLTAQWQWVDIDSCTLRLPDTKGGRPHYIHLNEPAMDILRNLPRMGNNPYIFPSLTCPGKRLWEVDKPWRRIRKEVGLDHVHIHDLRRSVGSWLAEDGVSLQIIGKVLGHRDTDTTAIYARLTEDPAKAAMDKIGQKVVSIFELNKNSKSA